MQNTLLMIAGMACLAGCGLVVNRLRPRDGKPEIAWMQSDTVATAVTLAVLILLVTGLSLLVSAAFA